MRLAEIEKFEILSKVSARNVVTYINIALSYIMLHYYVDMFLNS